MATTKKKKPAPAAKPAAAAPEKPVQLAEAVGAPESCMVCRAPLAGAAVELEAEAVLVWICGSCEDKRQRGEVLNVEVDGREVRLA